MKNILLISLCIILYGISTFLKKLALDILHPYQFLLVVSLCYALLFPVWWLFLQTESVTLPNNALGITYVVLYSLCSVSAGIVFSFLLRATNSPGTLSAFINLNSLITIILSFYFLGEEINFKKILSFIFAIVSITLINC